MDQTTRGIVDHLREQFRPSIIMLGGSRAEGSHTATSDWDLFLLGDFPKRKSVNELYGDDYLDITLTPKPSIEDLVYRISYGPLSCVRVLLDDENQLGQQIQRETELAYQRGPAALSSEQKKEYAQELWRKQQKLISYGSDPIARSVYAGDFYRLAILNWFELRREWSRPAYRVRELLLHHDPDFHRLLLALSTTSDYETVVTASQAVREALWGPISLPVPDKN